MPSLRITCLALLLALASALNSRATPPKMEEIISRVLAHDEEENIVLRTWTYHQFAKTEELDEQDRPVRTEEVHMIVRPGAEPAFTVVSDKSADAPGHRDPEELQSQAREVDETTRTFRLSDVAKRYQVTMQGEEKVNGSPAYVLAFKPKEGQDYKNMTEKVLNQFSGRIWVSQKDYSILRTIATLTRPVELAWVFASIPVCDFRYESQSISKSERGPAALDISYLVDTPIITVRQKQTIRMTDYCLRTEEDKLKIAAPHSSEKTRAAAR